jgi:hypothetical protein
MAKNTVLNLLNEVGEQPTVENIVALNYLGDAFEIDGESLGELEDILEECAEIADLESLVQPEQTHEIVMHVTPRDIEKARLRNSRYPKKKSLRLG